MNCETANARCRYTLPFHNTSKIQSLSDNRSREIENLLGMSDCQSVRRPPGCSRLCSRAGRGDGERHRGRAGGAGAWECTSVGAAGSTAGPQEIPVVLTTIRPFNSSLPPSDPRQPRRAALVLDTS